MRHFLPILAVFALLACSEPSSTEKFICGGGPYEFAVDMSDSTSAYSFDLFTRIDATEFSTRLQLDITWKDPQHASFSETVYLPIERGGSFFSQESYTPYRADMVPRECGTWTVTVTVPNPPEGLRGMGLVVRRTPLSF